MNYAIDTNARPLYLQLYRQLRDDIIRGVFPWESRLPSKRLLAEETGVSVITVEHAYTLLCEEGYAQSRPRSGYFVIFRDSDGFAATAEHISEKLTSAPAGGNSTFSVSAFSKAVRRVLSNDADILLKKSPNIGTIELRTAIGQYLARNRGMRVTAEQIVIGAGAEYLYRMIVELLGREKRYGVEYPSYEKIEQIYRSAGVAYERLPLVQDGIDTAALVASRVQVLQTTPWQSFPTGITASASKRHEYIRWAGQDNRFLIESDYGSEFSVSSQPMETLFVLSDRENVIYLNTFSRTVSPSVRIGYMVLPPKLAADFQEKLGFYSCTVATFEQLVLAELIHSGDFERHINRVRRQRRTELGEKN